MQTVYDPHNTERSKFMLNDAFNAHPTTYVTLRFLFFGVRADPSSVSKSRPSKISMNMLSKYDRYVQNIITNITDKSEVFS